MLPKKSMRERMREASKSMATKAAASLKKGAAMAGEGAKLAAAAAAKSGAELVKKIESAEPGKATVRRLLEGALNDWVEGGLGAEWRDENDDVLPEEEEDDDDGDDEGFGGAADAAVAAAAAAAAPGRRDAADAAAAPAPAAKAAPGRKGASLSVSLRRGELVLRDVRLRKRALEPLGASCLSVEAGSVGEVRLVLPWAHLGSRPVRVSLRRVSLTLRLTRDDEAVEDDAAKDGDVRRHELDLLEALREHWTALSEQGEDRNAKGFGRRVAARAFEKVDVEIEDVAFSYVGAGATFGVVLGSLVARDDEKKDGRRRLAGDVAGLGVSEARGGESPRWLVPPAGFEARVESNAPLPNTRPPHPGAAPTAPPAKRGQAAGWVVRAAAKDGLDVAVAATSVRTALETVDAYFVASRRVALRPFLPADPRPVTRASARGWWRYAFAFAAREAARHRPRDRWETAIRLLYVRERYVPLRCRAVAPKKQRARFPRLDAESARELADLEADATIPLRALLAFREQALALLRDGDDGDASDAPRKRPLVLSGRDAAKRAAATLSKSFKDGDAAAAAPADEAVAEFAVAVAVDCGALGVAWTSQDGESTALDVRGARLRLDADRDGGRSWTATAVGLGVRGGGRDYVDVADGGGDDFLRCVVVEAPVAGDLERARQVARVDCVVAPCAVALPALAAVARGLDDAGDLSLRTLAGEVLAYRSYRAELVESRRRRKPRPTFPECDAQILKLDVALDGPGDAPPLAASLAGVRCVRTLSDAGRDATTTTVEGTLGAALGATVLADARFAGKRARDRSTRSANSVVDLPALDVSAADGFSDAVRAHLAPLLDRGDDLRRARDPGQHERATCPTSKAPISAMFHSFRLSFGRAIISRNGLEAWMCFL